MVVVSSVIVTERIYCSIYQMSSVPYKAFGFSCSFLSFPDQLWRIFSKTVQENVGDDSGKGLKISITEGGS